MKVKEVLRKMGICILSAVVMASTVVPAASVYAGETVAQAETAPEQESGSEDGSGSGEDTPSEDPDTGSGEEEGGSDDGGDTTEDGGSDDGGGTTEDSGSDDGGDTTEDSGSDDGGDTTEDGGSDDGGDTTEDGGSDDGGDTAEESGSGDTAGAEDTGSGSTEDGSDNEGGEDSSDGDTGDQSGEGQTADSEDSNTGDTEQNSSADSTIAAPTLEPSAGSTEGSTAEKAKEKEPKKKDLAEDPEGAKEAENHNGTNEELLAQQHIVYDLPEIRKDFRFSTVDKVYAFSTSEAQVYEECSEESEVVGTIAKNGLLFELEDEEGGWFYVESGSVRGFIKGEKLIRGEDAEQILDIMDKQAERISALLPEGVSKDKYFFYAQETVPYYENDAYSFRRITTQETVIDKQAALAREDVGIMEERSDGSREAGTLEKGGLAYVIEDAGDGWLFVESGDVRGFVKASKLDRSGDAAKKAEDGEQNLSTAKEEIEPKDNKATYYTLTSVKEGAKYNEVREKILEKALSCVGNPYVWGGTSLTNGADCSGFVQTLYSLFGYHIPRVAAAQSTYGTQIPVSDAAPGDLIFFARNGYVYHVAMYAGDGKTVEAYSSNYGIITKELSDREAVWATRIIED